MKKVLEFIVNPQKMLALGICFFSIALVNSLMNNASSFGDLDWWGKSATVVMMVILGILVIRYLLFS